METYAKDAGKEFKEKMNHKETIKILREMACSEASNTERLKKTFSENDPYKVSYRLLVNMCAGWKRIGLEHFPTETEAIEMAKEIDPYFIHLFENSAELEGFKSTYWFVQDIWEEIV